MPVKTSNGKWKWGNIERASKKELVQTVYGIWKKNGSKGSFSDFLKGTHESLDESFNLNKTNLYFHGSFDKDIEKIDKPSVEHPFCVTQDIQYALDYADGGDDSDDSINGVVYLVTIDEGSLKIFDFEDDNDISRLNGKWPAKILDCFSKKNRVNKGEPIDPLIICDRLINDVDYSEDDSEITELMNTSVLKRLEKFVGKKWKDIFEFRDDPTIKSGEYILRNLLLTDIKDLGFNGYRAHEQSGHSSDKCFILFDLDCVDKIFLQPIPFKDAVAAAEYIDKKFNKGEVDADYKEHDAAIKEFIRSLNKTKKENMKESTEERYFVPNLDYNTQIKPVLDILKKWKRMEIGNITKHADDESMKWFGIYKGKSIEDIVALAAVGIYKADKEIFFNQINSGEKGMGKLLTDKMIEYFKKNNNGCDHISWLSDPGSGEQLKDFYRTNFPDAEETEEKNEWWQTSKFTIKLKEAYEPPYTLDTIKQKYGDEVYRKLRDDPVHKWRAETGIEVIHKEPTRDEFERIVKNWDLMTPEQKKLSDEFSNEQFGNNNKNRIELLRKEYDFEVGDRVRVRKGLRCRQSGHDGVIVRIDPPGTYDFDMHGWTSFVVKMDDPKLGISSFQSGNIDLIDDKIENNIIRESNRSHKMTMTFSQLKRIIRESIRQEFTSLPASDRANFILDFKETQYNGANYDNDVDGFRQYMEDSHDFDMSGYTSQMFRSDWMLAQPSK